MASIEPEPPVACRPLMPLVSELEDVEADAQVHDEPKSSGKSWKSNEVTRDTLVPQGKPSSRYSLPASEMRIECGGGREARNEHEDEKIERRVLVDNGVKDWHAAGCGCDAQKTVAIWALVAVAFACADDAASLGCEEEEM
ncbi:hypothetical protein PR202_ga26045 [Eleusine coracana subsp. coracana]|uniref:Uncharacterized protein n=1 Tax=Eleusine coracana subsp. coracana TaxID=191504 RepID=A0AAV5DD13_ELECO|nr:hypothetical protein PR202_ga26045 [Eleusine coracana subsp. coracana]